MIFHQVLKQVQLWCCLQHGVPQVQHQTCDKNKNCVLKFIRSSSSTLIGSPWTSNIVKSSLKALVSQISRSKNQNIKTKKSLKNATGPNGLVGWVKFQCECEHLSCTIWLQVRHTFMKIVLKRCELKPFWLRNISKSIFLQNHPDGFLLNWLLWHFLPGPHHEGAFWWWALSIEVDDHI